MRLSLNFLFGVVNTIDRELIASCGTAWDASGSNDYCDFGFGDVSELILGTICRSFWSSSTEK